MWNYRLIVRDSIPLLDWKSRIQPKLDLIRKDFASDKTPLVNSRTWASSTMTVFVFVVAAVSTKQPQKSPEKSAPTSSGNVVRKWEHYSKGKRWWSAKIMFSESYLLIVPLKVRESKRSCSEWLLPSFTTGLLYPLGLPIAHLMSVKRPRSGTCCGPPDSGVRDLITNSRISHSLPAVTWTWSGRDWSTDTPFCTTYPIG